MSDVFAARYTARVQKPVVPFLIGMRVNKLLAVGKWFPLVLAMPRMRAELSKKPEAGLLSYRTYISGRVILVQEYWESFESFDKLLAYAHDRSGQHFAARGAPSTGPSGPAARSASGTRPISWSPERPRAFTSTCRSSGSRQPPITSRRRGDSLRQTTGCASDRGQPDESRGGRTRRSFCVCRQTILTGMAPRKSRLPMSTPQ